MLPGGKRSRLCRAVASPRALLLQPGARFFAIDRLDPAALELVMASVQGVACAAELSEVTRHSVFDQLAGWPAGLGG